MTLSRRQLALLAVARKKLGLKEDEYRAALARIAGVASAKDLDQQGFDALMGAFERAGFEPFKPRGEDFGNRRNMATTAQLALVRELWAEITGGAYETDEQLERWTARTFGVTKLRFVDKATGQKMITALLKMRRRQTAARKAATA